MFKGDHLCLRGTTYHETSYHRGRCGIVQLTQINVQGGPLMFEGDHLPRDKLS
jgi:hypothetical protein